MSAVLKACLAFRKHRTLLECPLKYSQEKDVLNDVSADKTVSQANVSSPETVVNTSDTIPVDLSGVTSKREIDLQDFVIPDAPLIPQKIYIPEEALTCSDLDIMWYMPTGETLKCSNLTSYLGWIFETLTYFHSFFPWWGSIMLLTVIARTLTFPIMVYSQRKTTALANIMPKMKEYQECLQESTKSGNHLDMVKYSNKLVKLYEDNNLTPKKIAMQNLVLPLTQLTVFYSIFRTLRKMAQYPMESMKEGGLLWFNNLTIMDPTFALHILTSLTIYGVAKMGIEFGNQTMVNSGMSKVLQYGLPPLVFLGSWWVGAPNAVFVYWLTSNVISMGQVVLITRPSVRKYLKLPPIAPLAAKKPAPLTWSSIKESAKERYDSFTVNNVADPRRQQRKLFDEAGIGPIKKTYKYNPTKTRSVSKQ
ncbi:mitochondrial inner membrane protein OXA1L-like protein [Leptotrombidium deliense]|uniref:Mitochondrial inner membrane protein OXA1L-like protein n=1 Tax=Leptotrombidium deliense TaxID=299467 RepID=A0A443SCJ1_9ACAR|nr:mitochondrial inner membrane protein OXA1L-like protein [Leptotrombidium deliense]